MRYLSIMILLLVSCIFLGCDSNPAGSDDPEPRLIGGLDPISDYSPFFPDPRLPIDSTLRISVTKTDNRITATPDSVINITVSTDRIYPCVNYHIVQTVSTGRGIIAILLHGIIEPEICLTALGPAGASSAYDMADGSYTLLILHKNMADSYRLTVTGGVIEVTPVRTSFTHLPS